MPEVNSWCIEVVSTKSHITEVTLEPVSETYGFRERQKMSIVVMVVMIMMVIVEKVVMIMVSVVSVMHVMMPVELVESGIERCCFDMTGKFSSAI